MFFFPDDTDCDTGWYGWRGHCYLFGFNLNAEMFFDASKECVKRDALLLTINSHDEHELMNRLHNNMPYLAPPLAYGTGIHTPFFNQVYISADGSLILVSFSVF